MRHLCPHSQCLAVSRLASHATTLHMYMIVQLSRGVEEGSLPSQASWIFSLADFYMAWFAMRMVALAAVLSGRAAEASRAKRRLGGPWGWLSLAPPVALWHWLTRDKDDMAPVCRELAAHANIPTPVLVACATLCSQVYQATGPGGFTTQVPGLADGEILAHDTHVVAKYAVQTSRDSFKRVMVVAWGGSTTPLEWALDFSAARPVASQRLHGCSVRVHAGISALVENEFTVHAKEIAALADEHNIDELIFTGHSVGGCVAQVACVLVFHTCKLSAGTCTSKPTASLTRTIRCGRSRPR